MSNRYFAALALGLSFLTFSANATAQLIPDNTLGAENSVITPIDLLNQRIDGGASRGVNLFHSFLEFNVGNGRGVYFANPTGIENVLTRVTGGNASNIFGALGVLGNANLFLINPNGIYFGPNARLEVSGSFLATTADGIQLGSNGYFSATDPQGSQLLSVEPGALFSNALRNYQAEINNQGNLAVGGDLTLDADNLNLQGQLQAGGDLTLQATDTVQIRDSATTSFIASAEGNLLAQGNQNVDIFALNHPHSGLYSGGEMLLRSPNSVIGDAHYYSGGNFRIEKLDGSLGNLTSPNDPVIRSLGDVSFDSYEGTSLHIFAAGSVNIPGFVWIQNPDPINGIVENVTLSDDKTIVAIDGRNEPTLDIRAGLDAAAVGMAGVTGTGSFVGGPNLTPTPSSADINIGYIYFNDPSSTPQPGTILLTNQYRPNTALRGGTITVDAIDNFGDLSDGGDVFIDSRAGINLTGTLNTFSEYRGGKVTLLAQGNIQTGSIDTSGRSLGGGGGDVQIETNGDVLFDGSAIVSSTSGLIKSGDINVTAQSIELANGAELSAFTFGQGNAGGINIAADRVSIDGSKVFSSVASSGTGNGGNVTIDAGSVFLTNSTQLNASTEGGGNAGNVNINANTISIDGSEVFSSVASSGTGNGGDVTIVTSSLSLTNSTQLNASTEGGGNAGGVNITANTISIDDSNVFSSVALSGTGNGGTLTVNAAESVIVSSSGALSGLFTSTDGMGNAGDLNIQTGQLLVRGGARVSAATSGAGNAGNLKITSDRLIIQSGGEVSANTLSTGRAGTLNVYASELVEVTGTANDASRLFFDSTSSGDAGELTINTRRLVISNGGKISAATSGAGRGGILDLKASDSIEISGAGGVFFDSRGAGNARGIRMNTGRLVVENGAQITVSGSGTGRSGDLEVNANSVFLNNQGRLRATTVASEGGNLKLQVANSVILRNNSEISAEAFGRANGGNITFEVGGIIFAILSENSDVVANAFEGNGGRVTGSATGVFGFRQFEKVRTPESDFIASSALGFDGIVDIDEETRQLPNLPIDFLGVGDLNQDICALRNGKIAGGSSLVVTGRGGLPVDPAVELPTLGGMVEWATHGGERAEGTTVNLRERAEENEHPQDLRPARGWVIQGDGTVILTAEAPATDFSYSDRLTAPHCRVFSEKS